MSKNRAALFCPYTLESWTPHRMKNHLFLIFYFPEIKKYWSLNILVFWFIQIINGHMSDFYTHTPVNPALKNHSVNMNVVRWTEYFQPHCQNLCFARVYGCHVNIRGSQRVGQESLCGPVVASEEAENTQSFISQRVDGSTNQTTCWGLSVFFLDLTERTVCL